MQESLPGILGKYDYSSGAACAISRMEAQPVGLSLYRTYTTIALPLETTDSPPLFGADLIVKKLVSMATSPAKIRLSTLLPMNSIFEERNISTSPFSKAALPVTTLLPPKYFTTSG
jgi:hypothetical protein